MNHTHNVGTISAAVRWPGWRAAALALCAWLAAICPVAALNIVFDYRYDTNLYFGGTNAVHTNAWRRACLERAADELEMRLSDRLAAIKPQTASNFTWVSEFLDPSSPGATLLIDRTNDIIAADQVVVFVGVRKQPDPYDTAAVSYGEAGGVLRVTYSATTAGTEWYDAVLWRGQPGASVVSGVRINTNDFAPWGGCVTFGSTQPWFFNTNGGVVQVPVGTLDFQSFALHELTHVLGFGVAGDPFSSAVNARGAWSAKVDLNSAVFKGTNSVAAYGGPVPLDPAALHWKEATISRLTLGDGAQEAAMDPSLNAGTRKSLTLLDWAGLKDIGWQVTSRAKCDFAVTDVRVTAAGLNHVIVLTWRAQPGESNFVQCASSPAGPFVTVGNPLVATNSLMSATFTNAGTSAFYRVRMGTGL
jgi:hypothetical protein